VGYFVDADGTEKRGNIKLHTHTLSALLKGPLNCIVFSWPMRGTFKGVSLENIYLCNVIFISLIRLIISYISNNNLNESISLIGIIILNIQSVCK